MPTLGVWIRIFLAAVVSSAAFCLAYRLNLELIPTLYWRLGLQIRTEAMAIDQVLIFFPGFPILTLVTLMLLGPYLKRKVDRGEMTFLGLVIGPCAAVLVVVLVLLALAKSLYDHHINPSGILVDFSFFVLFCFLPLLTSTVSLFAVASVLFPARVPPRSRLLGDGQS